MKHLALLVLVASCSAVFPSVPEWKPGDPPLDCEEHEVAPMVDVAAGVGLTAAGLFAEGVVATVHCSGGCHPFAAAGVIGAVFFIPAVLDFRAARHQFADNRRCARGKRSETSAVR